MTRVADVPLAAIRTGNNAAFATLLEQHRAELRMHCSNALGSVGAAEDVVQETFLQAWRSRNTFHGDTPFGSWLYRIATELCRAWIQNRPHSEALAGTHPAAR